MHDFLEKILEVSTILLIFWFNTTTGQSTFFINVTDNVLKERNSRENLVPLESRSVQNALVYDNSEKSVTVRTSQPRSYYSSMPATPYIPAFDPISVLASLAFLAFLLQSFAALFDRTRSIIPTIVSSRRSSIKYGEPIIDIEERVLRALKEYASLSNNLLDNEEENEEHTS